MRSLQQVSARARHAVWHCPERDSWSSVRHRVGSDVWANVWSGTWVSTWGRLRDGDVTDILDSARDSVADNLQE